MINFNFRGFMENYDEFEKWVAIWDKLSKEEEFQVPTSNKEVDLNVESYFGVITESKNVDNKSVDSKYWLDLLNLHTKYGNDKNVLSDYLKGKLTNEDTDLAVKDFTAAITQAANPIRPNSVGMDQDPKNLISLGYTYTAEDLEKLEKLKNDLYELITKLNQSEIEGEDSKKTKSKLDNLQKEIDDLSDKMTRTAPQQS